RRSGAPGGRASSTGRKGGGAGKRRRRSSGSSACLAWRILWRTPLDIVVLDSLGGSPAHSAGRRLPLGCGERPLGSGLPALERAKSRARVEGFPRLLEGGARREVF